MIRALLCPSLTSLALASSSCVVRADPGPPVVVASDGSLLLDWSINDAKNAGDCAHYGADVVQVSIDFSDGASAGTFEQDCGAFATTISLQPGDYTATARLLDSGGRAVTTAVAIDPFAIHSGTELDIPIDFPDGSFL